MANSAPTLSQSLKFWLLFGLTSFGGPAAQIATMHEQLVDQKKWVSEADYQTGLTLAAVLPGPEAHQLATYLGWRLHGIRGAAGAAILFVIPSLLLISLIAALYSVNSDLKLIPNISLFLVPVAIALIGNAAVSMARKNRVGKRASAFIALVAAILIFTPVPAGIVVITGVVLSLLIPNAAKAFPAVMPAKDVRDAQIASRWSRKITLIA